MKKLLFIAFVFMYYGSQAQIFVNKVNLNDRQLQYVEVWEKFDDDKNRYVALVDFGQLDDRENDTEGVMLRVTNADGIVLEFNGIMHILNFMHRNGWEVIHAKSCDDYESFVMRRTPTFEYPISGSDN